MTNFINCFSILSILGGPFSKAQNLRNLRSSYELVFCQYIRIWGFNLNLGAHCRYVKMALTNFINCFSILGGPFSGAQGLRVLGSSCEVVFCQYIRIWGFNSNLWARCRHVKMALTNFTNCFSILGGPFSGAQGLRVLGSSCEFVFCQHIRIFGFNLKPLSTLPPCQNCTDQFYSLFFNPRGSIFRGSRFKGSRF